MTLNYFALISLAMGFATRVMGWKQFATAASSEEGEAISPDEWEELGYIIGSTFVQQIPSIGNEDMAGIVKGLGRALSEYSPDMNLTIST